MKQHDKYIETFVSFPNKMKHFFHNSKLIDLNQPTQQPNKLFQQKLQEKGGNKSKIGRAIGVSSQLLGQYANGRQTPKMEFFKKWKAVYGEDISGLFETNVSHGTLTDTLAMHATIQSLADSHKEIARANLELAEANRSLAKSNEEMVILLRISFGNTFASQKANAAEVLDIDPPAEKPSKPSGKRNALANGQGGSQKKSSRRKGTVA